MSYQVLARKYRPKNFDTLVGQEHVVRALTHALEQKRLHHAYLFTGTRGVGKTTLSRILAKSFNCEKGITAQPCGVCEACTAIDAGRFVDYIEMDAASNRGVDEMAQLLEQAIYAPSNARFKVYMIDEVHMLTNHAFNAMLKTLEEPPEHIKFILATTDPQKIPVTVLSRCLQFNLKQMPPGHIVGHLENILGQEGIEFEQPALRLLAQGAHGSMRDALSLTDQAIAYAAGKVSLEAVQGMLGALDQSYLIRLLDALAAQDGAGLLAVADEMAARSLSYNAALQDLGSLLHRIALAQTVPAAVPADLPEREDILRLATLFDAEEVQLFYQIAVHGRNELGLAPDEYAGFSMTLLRMLAFRPDGAAAGGASPAGSSGVARPVAGGTRPAAASSMPAAAQQAPAKKSAMASAAQTVPVAPAASIAPVASITPASSPAESPRAGARASGLSPAMAALKAAQRNVGARQAESAMPPASPGSASAFPETASSEAPVARTRTASEPAAMPSPAAAPALVSTPPWEDAPPQAPQREAGLEDAQKKTAPPPAEQAATLRTAEPQMLTMPAQPAAPAGPAASAAPAAFRPTPVPALNWDGDWPALAGKLPLRGVVQQLAQQSELVGCDATGGAVQVQLRIPLETLRSAGSVDKLSAALSEHFNATVRVETQIGAVSCTAHAQNLADRAERQRQAEETMRSDPFVQTLMKEFGATIVPGTIKLV